MAAPVSIGLVGLDTSHVDAFAKLLMDPSHPHHVEGGRIIAAFPGGSPDFELSHSRVPGYTTKLRDEYGVEILDSPEAVAERSDLVFIESVDGRVHRPQYESLARFRRPTFIDKPFATTVADARAILDAAAASGVPLMSCSALRYAANFQAALKEEPVVGIDVVGPLAFQPTQPGYFWYGIHDVEMLVAALGAGCRRVRATVADETDLVVLEWDDGRVAGLRGLQNKHGKYAAALHGESGLRLVDVAAAPKPFYAGLLQAILDNLPRGVSPISHADMLEVVRIIEAINRSRDTGDVVELEPSGVAAA